MEIRGHVGGLESTGSGVNDDTPGDQEAGQLISHASKSLDGRGSTKQKHGSNNDVGAHGEEEEGKMRRLAPSSADDLEEGVGRWRNILERDGKDAE